MKTSIFKRLNTPIDSIPKVFRIGNLRQALALGLIILLVVISYSSLSCIEGSRKPAVFLIFLGALLFMLYRFEIPDLLYLFLAFVFFLGSECFYKHFYNYDNVHIVLLIVFLAFIIYQISHKRPIFQATEFDWIVLIFLFVTIFEAALSFWKGNYWYNIFRELITYPSGILIFYIVINAISKHSQIDRFIKFIFLLTLIISLLGLIEYLKFAPEMIRLSTYVSYRIGATFHNANILAGLFELTIPLMVVYLLEAKEWKKRLFYLLIVVPPVISLVFTYSRGGFFGTLFSLFILLLLRFRGRSIIIIILLLVLIAGLATTTTLVSRQMFMFNYEMLLADPSMRGRILQYIGYVDNIIHHPILGVGWGVAESPEQYGYFIVSKFPIRITTALNSMVFDQMVKGGLIYFIPFFILLFLIFRKNLQFIRQVKDPRYSRIAWGVFGSILAFMPHQLVENTMKRSQPQSIFWFLLGLMYVAFKLYQKEQEKKNLPEKLARKENDS